MSTTKSMVSNNTVLTTPISLMKSTHKLMLFIVLVISLCAITVITVNNSKNHYTLVTTQGCCTINVDYDDNQYVIAYTDNVTPEYTQTVVEHTEYDANWTIAEMMHDYCHHHESNRGH